MKSIAYIVTIFLTVLCFEQTIGSHIGNRLKRACPGTSETGSQFPCIPARTNCVLPEYLENGFWRVFNEPERNAGEIVPAGTVLEFKCDSGYKLLPEVQFSVCNQQWSVLPMCMKTCDSLQSTDVMQIGCSLYNTEISCTNPYNGTRARMSCATTYDDPSLKDRPYLNCIDGKWDGSLPECKKVTDSISIHTSLTPVSVGSTCVLPEYPANGKWFSADKKEPGDIVAPNSQITYECNKGYKEYPENHKNVICLNGTFTAPTCLRTCISIESSNEIFASCFYRGQSTSCKNPYTSTLVRFSCGYMYKMSHPRPYTLKCLRGSWDRPLPICTPVCGVRTLSPLKLTTKEISRIVPWMTIIYEKEKYVCAGTLVAPHAVISSASCFNQSKESYTVSIRNNRGEIRRESKVIALIKHERFKQDSLYHTYDIAILILEKPFKLSETVLPVCLDYTGSLSKLEINQTGFMAIYGISQGIPSNSLITSEMFYQTRETCPITFKFGRFFVIDAFCATSRDKDFRRASVNPELELLSFGLMFVASDGLYYIRGISKIHPSNFDNLPAEVPVLFTDIEENFSFIIKTLELYRNTMLETQYTGDSAEEL